MDIEHSGSKHACLDGVEQPPVVLQSSTASGGVDQNRRRAWHRPHHLPRQTRRLVVQTGVYVKGATTTASRTRSRERKPHRGQDVCRRPVRVTQPSIHHATREQPHVGTSSGNSRSTTNWQPSESKSLGNQSRPLRYGKCGRPDQQETVTSQHRESEPLPPWRDLALGGQVLPCCFNQASERHPARACRLTSTALHAGRHEPDKVVVDRGTSQLHGPHCVDPPPRGQRLFARCPKRRTMRQAQPAGHAGVQIFGV